jgi:2-hydroxychromene-2-carboxylate isomerase
MVTPLKVEFQFDFGSPNACLAELALAGIERRTGAKFEYVPVLLGGIYKATNNMSPAESLRGIRNKPEYQTLETQRFIRRQDEVKKKLIEVTTDAVNRGAFGSPTFFVGGEMFFGKDQLRDVEESIVEQTSHVVANTA